MEEGVKTQPTPTACASGRKAQATPALSTCAEEHCLTLTQHAWKVCADELSSGGLTSILCPPMVGTHLTGQVKMMSRRPPAVRTLRVFAERVKISICRVRG